MIPAIHHFGSLGDGRRVVAITLDNGEGTTAKILTYGATLQSVRIPAGREGSVEVQPGHPTLDSYLRDPSYPGGTIGRVANRIAQGRFSLDGQGYQLDCNEPPHALHGGRFGFDKQIWRLAGVAGGSRPRVRLELTSEDGDQGYPGRLSVAATYKLDETGSLRIEYAANTDAPTIVNITHHGYWNLASGNRPHSAMRQVLFSPATHYLPIAENQMPCRAAVDVGGSPFDFRKPAVLDARLATRGDPQLAIARGYNHFLVLSHAPNETPRLLARLTDRASGRSLELLSNQPGFQLYTGRGDAIALEAQLPPNAPNLPEWGSVRLDPGQIYRNITIYRLSTNDPESASV